MAKARLKFTRTGTFVETGECVVDVDDLAMGEIDRVARSKEFTNFVVQARIYDDEAWHFQLLATDNDETNRHSN